MLNSKLSKWFVGWAVLMILLIIVFQPETRPDKLDAVSFDTNEADELYFKNVRLFYYSTLEEGAGALDVHRLNSIGQEGQITLPFAIYHSWRANEAFIRLDTAFSKQYYGASLLKDSAGIYIPISTLPEADNVSQYIFAKNTYKALSENFKLGLEYQGSQIWLSESTSRSVRQCLKDYFKLVGKL